MGWGSTLPVRYARARACARERPVFRKCCAGAPQVDECLDHSIPRDAAEHRNFHRYRHLLGVLFGLMRATENRVLANQKTSAIAWYSLPSPRRFSPQSACPGGQPVGAPRNRFCRSCRYRSATCSGRSQRRRRCGRTDPRCLGICAIGTAAPSLTMPALMESRAPPPPGSRSGRMIPEPAGRSRALGVSQCGHLFRSIAIPSAIGDLTMAILATIGQPRSSPRTGRGRPRSGRRKHQIELT
jgi:hypothetical protein